MAVDGAISNTLAAIVSKLCWTVTDPPNWDNLPLATVKVSSNVTASSTFKVPLTVVIIVVSAIFTAVAVDGAISNTLAAIVSKLCWTVTVPPNWVALFSATVKVSSNVTASSTFKVPFIVVIAPEVAISTVPLVWAIVVAPATSKVPATFALPLTSKLIFEAHLLPPDWYVKVA